MRTRSTAALAVLATLGAAPCALGAGTLSLTDPSPRQVVGTTPEFAGTGFTDGISGVTLLVDGPGGFVATTPVYGDGTWALSGRQVSPGAYSVRACQDDAAGAQSCTATVSFTVRSAGGGSFTARAPQGSFRDLLDGKLTLPVHCPQDCTVAARLIVAAQDARRMAFPLWRANQVVGTESDEDNLPAGTRRLPLVPASAAVGRQLRGSLAFPIFGWVGIKVEIQADWGEGSYITSVTGRLRWPSLPLPRTRRGSIRSIAAPGTVALGARSVSASVRLGPGRSLPRGGVRSAGALLDGAGQFFSGDRVATPAQLRRGGTFTLVARWDEEATKAASGVAPLPAEVFVKRGGKRAARRFTVRG